MKKRFEIFSTVILTMIISAAFLSGQVEIPATRAAGGTDLLGKVSIEGEKKQQKVWIRQKLMAQ